MLPMKLNWNFREKTHFAERSSLALVSSAPTEMQRKLLLLFICKTHNRLPLNTNHFECTMHMCIVACVAVAKSTNQTPKAKSSLSCSVCLQFRKTFTLYDIEIFVFRKMQITFVSHWYSNTIFTFAFVWCVAVAAVAPILYTVKCLWQNRETCTKRIYIIIIITSQAFLFLLCSSLRLDCCRCDCNS